MIVSELHKLEEWQTIVEDDLSSQVWLDSDSSGSDESDSGDDDDDSDSSEDMDVD